MKMPWDPVCAKRKLWTEKWAVFLATQHEGFARHYFCEECKAWHITSSPDTSISVPAELSEAFSKPNPDDSAGNSPHA